MHHGWAIDLPDGATLTWPLYPHNPYADAPETNIGYAVGRLTVPLALKAQRGRYVRPSEQELTFRLSVF